MVRRLIKSAFGARALTRQLLLLDGATIVLCYHDLRVPADPPSWMRPSADQFDRHLRWLGRVGRFIAPDELDTPARRGELRILITFDDGYRNNHDLAWPILKRHGTPALFFVSTAHLESGEVFWFDRITGPLLYGDTRRLDLRRRDLGVVGLRAYPPHERWDDIDGLLTALKSIGPATDPRVAGVIADIEELSPLAMPTVEDRCRPLNRAELLAMAADPLCHFASHGHPHDILVQLDDNALRASLEDSRRILTELLESDVHDLAYPNGEHGPREREMARTCGYTRAFTVKPAAVSPDDDPMALPRLLVGGFDTTAVLGYRINRMLLSRRRAPARG